MRPIWAIAAFLALACAACTSSSSGTPPTRTMTPPHTSAPTTAPTTAPPVPSTSGFSGPPHPAQPTVPADVPRTGPNTQRGEKPPVMPLEATQHTPEGAKAFAAFFIKTIDWGFAVISGTYAAHFSSPRCKSCSVFISGLNQARRLKHRYIGGRITVTKTTLTPKPLARAAGYTGVVKFDIESFEELTKSGKFVRGDGAHAGERFEVSLTWSAGHWSVVRLAVDA